MYLNSKDNTWRAFQSELQLDSRRKTYFSVFLKIFIFILIVFIAGFCLKLVSPYLSSEMAAVFKKHSLSRNQDNSQNLISSSEKYHNELTGDELKNLLADHHIPINPENNHFILNDSGRTLEIHTSINIPLQHFIIDKLDKLKTLDRGKPQRIAMVVMEPGTGRVLAMAGFDLSHADFNVCTNGEYPAASVFKIVTASAAIEDCGFNPGTITYFNGGKYTLYKRQLKVRKNKYTTKISFAHAFAESINPVFGKIGSRRLGGHILERYASAFGFNKKINSEFSFKTGVIKITDRSYQWAEVGCGFNETTRISPMFGAILSSTLLDSGRSPIPSLVDKVTDTKGKIIYRREKKAATWVVNPNTARSVMEMMEKTITMGTASKSFRGFRRDRILSKLVIGGKTGSISNKIHTVKYDWFTGFARAKNGKKQIAFAVVVGHRKYIGTRAAMYGKMIIKEYFTIYLDSKNRT